MNEIEETRIDVEEIIRSAEAENSEYNNEGSPLSEEEMRLLEQIVEETHQEIPINSGSLLIDESTSRFSSAIWYNKIQEKVIILAGVGGIGRFGNLINF